MPSEAAQQPTRPGFVDGGLRQKRWEKWEVGSGKWEMEIGNSMASTILTFYLHPRLEGVRVPMGDRLLEE
jgi:hypothetical protein